MPLRNDNRKSPVITHSQFLTLSRDQGRRTKCASAAQKSVRNRSEKVISGKENGLRLPFLLEHSFSPLLEWTRVRPSIRSFFTISQRREIQLAARANSVLFFNWHRIRAPLGSGERRQKTRTNIQIEPQDMVKFFIRLSTSDGKLTTRSALVSLFA